MATPEMRATNVAGYERVKAELPARYPHGQSVAFHNGEIVADDTDFRELLAKLRGLGLHTPDCMVVTVGEVRPEFVNFTFIQPVYPAAT